MKTVELWINYGIMALTNKITFDLTKSFGDQRENNLKCITYLSFLWFCIVVVFQVHHTSSRVNELLNWLAEFAFIVFRYDDYWGPPGPPGRMPPPPPRGRMMRPPPPGRGGYRGGGKCHILLHGD